MEIGQSFFNYTIEKTIGTGSLGTVYLARHMQFDRKVALKVIHLELIDHKETRLRFRQEAETLSKLQHPNIVMLYDYIEDESGVYLVTEYAAGQPLDLYIQQTSGPISEHKTQQLFLQVLEGVAYAHHMNIIHRDLKPANIIISEEGQVKLLDFGMTKILDNTQTSTKRETVIYKSPEQIRGDIIDKRSDIYTLGVILFQMLTGKPPYYQEQSAQTIASKIVSKPLPSPRAIHPAVSDQMVQVIQKATQQSSFQRYQTCEEFSKAFIGGIVVETPMEKVPIKKVNNLTFLWVFLSLSLVASGYIIISNMLKDDASDVATTTDTTLVREEVIVDNTQEEFNNFSEEETTIEEEEEEEEEKTPEEIEADSLRAIEEEKEERLQALKEKRSKEALANLIVDGQFISNTLGEYKVRVELFNKNKDVALEDITIGINYYNSNDKVIARTERTFDYLGKSEGSSMEVTKSTQAARFSCQLLKANLTEDEQVIELEEDTLE